MKDGMNLSFGEIETNEKDLISHRANAFKNLLLGLKRKILNQITGFCLLK